MSWPGSSPQRPAPARSGRVSRVSGAAHGPRPPRRLPLAHRVRIWFVWWVVLMALWVSLDYSIATDELLAGAGAAALAAFLAEVAGYQAEAWLRTRARWLVRA